MTPWYEESFGREDLKLYTHRDLEEARKAKRRLKRSGEKPIPLEDVARELGIELPHG